MVKHKENRLCGRAHVTMHLKGMKKKRTRENFYSCEMHLQINYACGDYSSRRIHSTGLAWNWRKPERKFSERKKKGNSPLFMWHLRNVDLCRFNGQKKFHFRPQSFFVCNQNNLKYQYYWVNFIFWFYLVFCSNWNKSHRILQWARNFQ